MFCGKCGMKNMDDAAFCSGCGEKLNVDSTHDNGKPENQNRKVGMIAVAVAAVVMIALIIGLFGGRGYKATIEKFVNAQFDADVKTLFKLLPKDVVKYALEEEGYDDDELDEFMDEIEERLQDELDSIESYLDEDWSYSYEILEIKNITGDDLDDLKDEYRDMDVKVSAAKDVEIEFTITAGETEMDNSLDISVIKVGRSWYLDIATMGGLF